MKTMRELIVAALGLPGILAGGLAAADDATTNGPPTPYYYTEGGKGDAFIHFDGMMRFYKVSLDGFDKGLPFASDAAKETALNEVRMAAMEMDDAKVTFAIFFAKSHLPPDAQAVAKPLFDSLKDDAARKDREALSHDLAHADIGRLRQLYALYAKLPFPTDRQWSHYVHAWDVPGQPGDRGMEVGW